MHIKYRRYSYSFILKIYKYISLTNCFSAPFLFLIFYHIDIFEPTDPQLRENH